MCISLEISIVAGLIGEICAFILFKRKQIENASFLAVYSLIQFYEAYSYYKDDTPRFPIQVLLATQGVAYFLPTYLNDNNPLSLSCLIISICILLCVSFVGELYETNCIRGCRWKIGKVSKIILLVMYILIIGYGLTKTHLKFFSIFVIISLIISLCIPNHNLSLSWWCFLSAIMSPLYCVMYP